VRIGAHLRTRGGVLSAVEAARETGAEAFQLFASNPRAWAGPRVEPVADEFRDRVAEAGLGPIFLHAPYLVNIASPNPLFHRRSVDLARASMEAAEVLGGAGLVVHAGAGGPGEPAAGSGRAAAALREIAAEGSDAWVVVELMAGSAGAVASSFAEARRLLDAAGGSDRMKLCVDTCHAFASGYGLDTPSGVAETFADLRRSGLARRLVLVHANDAAFPLGSRRDRHANVGRGFIGPEGFAAVLTQPTVRRATVLCETPGDRGQTAADVAALKRFAARGVAA
jgi:deoxyribonuclease-4